ARVERPLDRGRYTRRVADPLIRQHSRVADVRVNAVRRPARPPVWAGERRLRRGKIGVEIRDPVYVFGVQVFGRAGDAPGELLVDGDVAAPQLRELEIRIGEGKLEARRGRACDRRGLVRVRVRVEGIRRGVVLLNESSQHAGVADLIGDPHVCRPPGENSRAAAYLSIVISAHIVIEAETR